MVQIRSWLALHIGCDPDELRFAGADARRVNNVVLHFTPRGDRGLSGRDHRTGRATAAAALAISAEWPKGTAAISVDEKPSW
jgi:hypothetical protein